MNFTKELILEKRSFRNPFQNTKWLATSMKATGRISALSNDYFETLDEIDHARSHGLPTVGIGHRCYIKNAIVDKNCRIGDDVRINGGNHLENSDHSLYTVKDGIVVIKKGAVLPNGFVI